jgi:hypothetical protein
MSHMTCKHKIEPFVWVCSFILARKHFNQLQTCRLELGQTKDTTVYRLVSAGTIEETMYQRQIYKQQLANIAMEGRTERR